MGTGNSQNTTIRSSNKNTIKNKNTSANQNMSENNLTALVKMRTSAEIRT